MAKEKKNSTQERLLDAAARLFAEKGFRGATVAEICNMANANIAAINYHFGDKKTLYAKAWQRSFQQSLTNYPPDGGVPADAPARERLYGNILSTLRRINDPENFEFEIVQKEMANPTGLLAEVMCESLEPLRIILQDIIDKILGDDISPIKVRLCHMSIRSQCFDYMNGQKMQKLSKQLGIKIGPPPLKADIEEVAAHITQFSLAGLHEVRRAGEHPGQ